MEEQITNIQENIASVNLMKKHIILKGVALIGTLGLLVILAVVGTVGWYTHVSSVDAITMDVASFDFTANYVNETFLVNTSEYAIISDFKVAPGSSGVIPIRLTDYDSNVDVHYELSIDTSNTAPEFKRRIRYFYYAYDSNGNITEYPLTSSNDLIENTIPASYDGHVTEYVYWEWVYDLNKDMYYDLSDSTWKTSSDYDFYWNVYVMEKLGSGLSYGCEPDLLSSPAAIAIDDFNELDTHIGLGHLDQTFVSYADGINATGKEETGRTSLKTYTLTHTTISSISSGAAEVVTYTAIQQAMEATIKISGAQTQPTSPGAILPDTTYGGISLYVGGKKK